MGKRAKEKRERRDQNKGEIKALKEKNYYEKNSWLKFWTRVDFWIYALCLILLVAFPFVMKNKGLYMDDTTSSENKTAVIHTSMGDIEVLLYAKDAPKTVENFVNLTNENFYDNLLWHRVIKGFMIQTGDPTGDGTGGPGYEFEDEINSHKIVKGTLAMANAGANTNGSQFFIVTDDPQPHLDGKHTVFGEVTSGMEVVKVISEAPVDENDKPLSPVMLQSVEIK